MVALAAAGLALGACSMGGYGSGPGASARLEPRSASSVNGEVAMSEESGRLLVRYDLKGLKPNAEHGFHVHDKGDCSAPDAASAGGHFNPGGAAHGHHGSAARHAGDMPNVRADANGAAKGSFQVDGLTLAAGPRSVIGRGLVVHRDPDDYRSQPAGNSGPRVACGVIVAR